MHADRNPLFRQLLDAKGPPLRVANTKASALRSAEIEKWAFNASATAGDSGTSLLLARVFGVPNRPKQQVSATTSVCLMNFMRFHRNARISPIRSPVKVASKTMVLVGSAHAAMRRRTPSTFNNWWGPPAHLCVLSASKLNVAPFVTFCPLGSCSIAQVNATVTAKVTCVFHGPVTLSHWKMAKESF